MDFATLFILLSISIVTSHSFVQAASASAVLAPAPASVAKATPANAAASSGVKAAVIAPSKIAAAGNVMWSVSRLRKNGRETSRVAMEIPQGASVDQVKAEIRKQFGWPPARTFELYEAYFNGKYRDEAQKCPIRNPFKDKHMTMIPLRNLDIVKPAVGVYAFTDADVKTVKEVTATRLAEKQKPAAASADAGKK